jgi:hypothetical protein
MKAETLRVEGQSVSQRKQKHNHAPDGIAGSKDVMTDEPRPAEIFLIGREL